MQKKPVALKKHLAISHGLPCTRQDYLKRRARYSPEELLVGGFQVMQAWERPLMKALALEAARNRGHVLEVGFGMGISAQYLVDSGCTGYTVIEPHPSVVLHFQRWARKQRIPVHLVKGFWQDVIDSVGMFDGILFDTFPASSAEASELPYVSFVKAAAEHLNDRGIFTFYSGFSQTFPAKHKSLLAKHFSHVRFRTVTGLRPPKHCRYFRHKQMLVPICVK